jgi:hypothetical protein
MRPLDGILDELDDLARKLGTSDLREAPPKSRKGDDEPELVGLSGRPLRKDYPKTPDDSDEPDDEEPDKPKETPKTAPGVKRRERLDRAKDFVHDALRSMNLRGAEQSAVIDKTARMDGREGTAITMWDTDHNILVSVFVDDENRGKAFAMKVEKKEGTMRQALDLSDDGFERSAREVASFVRGL